MKGIQEEKSPKADISVKKFEGLRCSTPECRQVLFEFEKSFLIKSPESSTCPKCGSEAFPILSSYSEDEIGKLVVRFWCGPCRDEFDRKIPSIRKYCKGCKKFHHIFLSLLMALPHNESNQDRLSA